MTHRTCVLLFLMHICANRHFKTPRIGASKPARVMSSSSLESLGVSSLGGFRGRLFRLASAQPIATKEIVERRCRSGRLDSQVPHTFGGYVMRAPFRINTIHPRVFDPNSRLLSVVAISRVLRRPRMSFAKRVFSIKWSIWGIWNEICVLEAMKMRQSLRADWSGIVKTIHVIPGQQVQDGEPIAELE